MITDNSEGSAMSDEDPPQQFDTEVPPVTPHTTPHAMPPPLKGTAWPKVLGIICIIFGVFGSLGGCIGMFTPLMLEPLSAMMPPEQREPYRATMEEWMTASIAISIIAFVLAVTLTIGGIQLLKKRKTAIPLLRVWAAAKMVLVVVNAFIAYRIQEDQFALMQEAGTSAQNMPPGMDNFMNIVMIFSSIFGVLWGWALPVFLLIWLSRRTIQDQIKGWK